MRVIRDLISYRLHVVANLLSRGAELRYRREFGVSLWEWRTVAHLGAEREPLSLNELARFAGVHKSQMSRVVTGLAERKLVLRAADEEDARGVRITLSKSGRRLYQDLIGAATERDEVFRRALTRDEAEAFNKVLAKLTGQARALIEREKQRARK
jgi:DNA-binding MarR family transcriptional regulator